jgi:hypothetical protein
MLQTWVKIWAAVLPALEICAFISTFIIAGLVSKNWAINGTPEAP